MLAKVFANTIRSSNTSAMTTIVKRGAYTAGQEPKVFVNKNTRVLCQGITGKHVSPSSLRFNSSISLMVILTGMSIGYFPHPAGYCVRH
jgi:hypothetical protein